MYIPKHFEAPNAIAVRDLIDRYAFGILASTRAGRIDVSHVPFLRVGDDRLLCHLARGNPQAALADGESVTAIFTGPHAYVSPSWYDVPGVPTWNYAAAQVHGEVTTFADRQRLRDLVEQLASVYEAAEWEPWTPRYELTMLDHIVGIDIRVHEIESKFKLSQNRAPADRLRVIDALHARRSENGARVAALMTSALPPTNDAT